MPGKTTMRGTRSLGTSAPGKTSMKGSRALGSSAPGKTSMKGTRTLGRGFAKVPYGKSNQKKASGDLSY